MSAVEKITGEFSGVNKGMAIGAGMLASLLVPASDAESAPVTVDWESRFSPFSSAEVFADTRITSGGPALIQFGWDDDQVGVNTADGTEYEIDFFRLSNGNGDFITSLEDARFTVRDSSGPSQDDNISFFGTPQEPYGEFDNGIGDFVLSPFLLTGGYAADHTTISDDDASLDNVLAILGIGNGRLFFDHVNFNTFEDGQLQLEGTEEITGERHTLAAVPVPAALPLSVTALMMLGVVAASRFRARQPA